ncbi:MAG: translocation/assembly module TamB domain-containing protein, partial [Gammaproteobacteria bacterium]
MNLSRRLALVCTALILLMAAAGSWLLYSQQALEWLLATAARQLPGQLVIGTVHGRLAGPLTLGDVQYRDETSVLMIDQLRLEWRPRRLLTGTLELSLVALQGVDVTHHSRATASSSAAGGGLPPPLSLPVDVQLAQLLIQAVRIHGTQGTTPLVIDSLQAAVDYRQQLVHLTALNIDAPYFTFNGTGTLKTAGAYPLRLSSRFSLATPQLARLAGTLNLSGDLQALRIRQSLDTPLRSRLTATLKQPLHQPRWDARLDITRLVTTELRQDWETAEISGRILSRGTPASFTLEAQLDTAWRGEKLHSSLQAVNHGRRLTIDELVMTIPQRQTMLHASGALDYREESPRIQLQGRWQGLRWPLADAAQLQSKAGTFLFDGAPRHYHFQMDGDLGSTILNAERIEIRGRGTDRGLQLKHITARLLDGRLTGWGRLEWTPQLLWDLKLKGTGLNPGRQWPDWPGRLRFALRGSGKGMPDAQGTARIELRRIDGELRGQPLSGHGLLDMKGTELSITPLVLSAGDARLAVSGKLGAQWAMSWYLDAPDLARLLPDAGGALTARGSLGGAWRHPAIALTLEGRQLHYRTYQATQLNSRVQWYPDDHQASSILLNAMEVDIAGQHLRQLALQGSGQTTAHELNLWLDGGPFKALFQLRGAYQDHRWRGRFPLFRLTLPDDEIWQAMPGEEIVISGQALSLPRWCLHGADGSLCLEGTWDEKAGWRAALRGERLPLQLLNHWLPSDVSLQARASLAADFRQPAAGKLGGSAEIFSPRGSWDFEISRDERLSLQFHKLLIRGRIEDGIAHLETHADLSEQGRLAGEFRLPIPALHPADDHLTGHLEGTLRELGMISLLFPDVTQAEGQLQVSLQAAGTLTAPALQLTLDLNEGGFMLPALGIHPRDITIHARSRDGDLHYRGQARSGPGKVEISGLFRPGRGQTWRLEGTLQGERFKVLDTPQYRLLVSPDLNLQLTPRAAYITGTVGVPKGRLQPTDLGGIIRPSGDVVIVKKGAPPAEEHFTVTSIVRLELGKQVRFDGFGLKGRITGNVVIMDYPGQLTTAAGELRVEDGSYRAYGQDLTIERGRLIFVGGPFDDPGLDIRATRKIQQVTAGLYISGYVSRPRLRIFSDPAMSESDALS